ncbi:Holliday junction branch migration protein RuvA [Neosynechococcus sphagnicola]|uniref:Holliday junction branch migration protein RuvA n=1 Tax=Neosynechococcus sphagnicola TaxID=1501145 RepID=UPI000A6C8B13|nr:Holliday junction branch migration protein RuvA [Neosynechococcus sphagnicola]
MIWFSTALQRLRNGISSGNWLASVGVGPQLAIALLDTLGLQDLVQAIVAGNSRVLSRTPGVGSKTAERLALELKTKLAEWRQRAELTTLSAAGPTPDLQEDVEMTLLALGYTNREISSALQAVGQQTSLAKNCRCRSLDSGGDRLVKPGLDFLSTNGYLSPVQFKENDWHMLEHQMAASITCPLF